jgi:hypothetical protein
LPVKPNVEIRVVVLVVQERRGRMVERRTWCRLELDTCRQPLL